MLRFLKTMAAALILPAAGWFAAETALARLEGRAFEGAESGYFAEGLGAEATRLGVLQSVAIWTAVASLAILALFFVLGRFAGANRARNAAIFPTLMPLTTLLVALILLAQGASMSAPALLNDFHSGPWAFGVGLLGLGALVGGVLIALALWRMSRPQPEHVSALPLSREAAPAVWSFVEHVAQRIDARTPDHVVLGLEPNFFATAAEVETAEGVLLTGETLYLSAPMIRLFTEEELTAVVAHELGHFAGADTEYSLRFAPVYRRIAIALSALRNSDGSTRHLGVASADAILRWLLETFGRNERAISRDREFEADQVGLTAASPEALGLSLAKVAVYAPVWSAVRERNAARLNEGRISRNLSRVYADSARYDVSSRMIDRILELVLATKMSHPTDTHPTVSERYQAVGFDPARLTIETLTRQGDAASALVNEITPMEARLTLLEHKSMVALGAARAPEGDAETGTLVRFAYALAATMTVADGVTDQREIGLAEAIGAELFEGFDPTSFREIVAEIADMPPFRHLLDLLADGLDMEQKRALHAYLGEIAQADGALAAEEAALLEEVVARWRIAEPRWRPGAAGQARSGAPS